MAARKKTPEKTSKKTKRVTKRELDYIVQRLTTIDMSIYIAAIIKEVENKENAQLSLFQTRLNVWQYWKAASSTKLSCLLKFLVKGFCNLLSKHSKGKERFAQFLISWHMFVGTIAGTTTDTAESISVWSTLVEGLPTISPDDRSALVFAIANCSYTFLQQQVPFFTC